MQSQKNCLKPANDTYIRLQYSNWVNGKEGRIGSLSFVKCFGWLLIRLARPFWPLLNWTVRSFIFSIRLSGIIVSVSVFCAFSVLVSRRDVKDPLASCKEHSSRYCGLAVSKIPKNLGAPAELSFQNLKLLNYVWPGLLQSVVKRRRA